MRKQSQKQLEFQLNGPYRSYTQRWIRLHQENNRRLLWILLPTILYMFTQNPWFLLIGLCYLAAALLFIMYIWHRGTQIEDTQAVYLKVSDYQDTLGRLRADEEVPVFSDNLIYLTKSPRQDVVERDILYSILNKGPKRARAYWFISIHVEEVPYKKEYAVESFGTDYIFRIKLNLGFKENQRINIYLRQIVQELMKDGELPLQQQRYAVDSPGNMGSFRFCIIRKRVVPESDLRPGDRQILNVKYAIRHAAGSPARWYGLENSTLAVEYLPLFLKMKEIKPIRRSTSKKQ